MEHFEENLRLNKYSHERTSGILMIYWIFDGGVDYMKKKIIIGICIFLAIICLTPFQMHSHLHFEDGCTVTYKAILYQVEYVYKLGEGTLTSEENLDGMIVKLLGMEVYNSCK